MCIAVFAAVGGKSAFCKPFLFASQFPPHSGGVEVSFLSYRLKDGYRFLNRPIECFALALDGMRALSFVDKTDRIVSWRIDIVLPHSGAESIKGCFLNGILSNLASEILI